MEPPKEISRTQKRIDLSSLRTKEDWWAVWLGFTTLALATTGIISGLPKIGKWTTDIATSVNLADVPYFVLLALGLLALTSIAVLMVEKHLRGYWLGFPIIFTLAFASFIVGNQSFINYLGLENVLWALLMGLLIGNTVGVPTWLKPAIKTELFIKIGLVLLGAEILFNSLLSSGAAGVFEITVGLMAVWYFTYYLGKRLGLSKSFAAVMASATSICGVSAAIAAGGAVKGDPKEVSYTISLVLLIAMPMLVLLPLLGRIFGMPDAVVGAWIGGTIDTTPAVVAAGSLFSKTAMEVASIIKVSQNALMGLAAFFLTMYWTLRVEKKPQERPGLAEIWYRFPKFIVGFILASIVFSFLVLPIVGSTASNTILNITKGIRGWYFAMAFVCIGLDTKFRDLIKIGRGRPLIVFAAATALDIVLSLISAYIFFGGIVFPRI